MAAQIEYYNHFGTAFKKSILTCPEPHFWTTDYQEKGRVYKEIKDRVELQEKFVDRYFVRQYPILDIGCGFGRQAILFARRGYSIIGTETSPVFIEIANQLFEKHGMSGKFLCLDILDTEMDEKFRQVLLLDVLEHIPPPKRKTFIKRIRSLMEPNARLLLSLPHVKKRLTSQINNRVRRALTQHLAYFRNREEHPYPIPQPEDITHLIKDHFAVIEFLQSQDTDYYVLELK